MTDRERIIATMSPSELALFRSIGGVLPRDLEVIAVGYGRALNIQELPPRERKNVPVAIVDVSPVVERKPRKASGPRAPKGDEVLSNQGHWWPNLLQAAVSLGTARQSIRNGCKGQYRVKGLRLYWRSEAPKEVLRLVRMKRRAAA
jgi:hypothetical protein